MTERGPEGPVRRIRRDEDGTRAKERYFSPRNRRRVEQSDQPPEFWNQFKTHFRPGRHIRIHPILELDRARHLGYIRREEIPILDLYFARGGRRYRSLGCGPCTGTIASEARS